MRRATDACIPVLSAKESFEDPLHEVVLRLCLLWGLSPLPLRAPATRPARPPPPLDAPSGPLTSPLRRSLSLCPFFLLSIVFTPLIV